MNPRQVKSIAGRHSYGRTGILSVLVCLVALSQACGMEVQQERPTSEKVGKSQAPIASGNPDLAGQFPFVGHFGLQIGPNTSSCSAILITPAWVLTANHCITGACEPPSCGCVAYPGMTDSEPVNISFPGTGGGGDVVGQHTSKSGEIHV